MISAKELEARCVALLQNRGFEGVAGVVKREISSGFFAWVGLNIGRHSTFLRINPNIGIHCKPIMEFFAKGEGKAYKVVKNVATYSVPLGHVAPEVDQFIVREDSDVHGELLRMDKVIAERGEPYMRSLANYDSLIAGLGTRVGNLGGNPEMLISAYVVSGAHEKAQTIIEELKATYAADKRWQSVLVRFSKFADFAEEQIRLKGKE